MLQDNKKEIDNLVSNLLGNDSVKGDLQKALEDINSSVDHEQHSDRMIESTKKQVQLTTVDLEIIDIAPQVNGSSFALSIMHEFIL